MTDAPKLDEPITECGSRLIAFNAFSSLNSVVPGKASASSPWLINCTPLIRVPLTTTHSRS